MPIDSKAQATSPEQVEEDKDADEDNEELEGIIPKNFCLVFGTRSGGGVKSDTKMVMDTVKILTTEFDRKTFSITFVKCF